MLRPEWKHSLPCSVLDVVKDNDILLPSVHVTTNLAVCSPAVLRTGLKNISHLPFAEPFRASTSLLSLVSSRCSSYLAVHIKYADGES